MDEDINRHHPIHPMEAPEPPNSHELLESNNGGHHYDEEMDARVGHKRKSLDQSDEAIENGKKSKYLNESGDPADDGVVDEVPRCKSPESLEELHFSDKDIPMLIDNMEKLVPANDRLTFRTRIKKLDWTSVKFSEYSEEQCQGAWHCIQKKIRSYRLLSEMLKDARNYVDKSTKPQKPPKPQYNGHVPHNYPDFPTRPFSAKMLFYTEKKQELKIEFPNLSDSEITKFLHQEYNELPDTEKKRFTDMSIDRHKLYEVQLEEFYTKHPDVPRHSNKFAHAEKARRAIKPFILYYEELLRGEKHVADRKNFKEQCKERWKVLPEEKKLTWIDAALDLEKKTSTSTEEIDLRSSQALTKEEKQLKERLCGKPVKPPNSAYMLFSRNMLKSEEMKLVLSKDKMKLIAGKWKELDDQEKLTYQQQIIRMAEEYKTKYAMYLESLTPEQREQELKKDTKEAKVPIKNIKVEVEEIELPPTPTPAPPPTPVPEETKEINDLKEEKETPKELLKDPKEQKKLELMEAVVPDLWDEMDDNERTMYLKYILKIKEFYDTQHKAASDYVKKEKKEVEASPSEADNASE